MDVTPSRTSAHPAQEATTMADAPGATGEHDPDHPTTLLPLSQLVRLSVYWLGLVAVFQGINLILQERIKVLVPDPTIQYTTLSVVFAAGVLIAVLVQPTVGSISDYTISRFGRRKPYILIGTTFDLILLIGLATSNSIVVVAAFVVLLQFSSNFAQGPFQGYIPDLVPAPQVGLASALVGVMQILGNVAGFVIGGLAVATGEFALGLVSLGILELV